MALPTADRQKIIAAYENTLQILGIPAIWKQTKPPNATRNCTVGIHTVGFDDTELANAYGIGAKVFTVSAKAVPLMEKFDRIEIGTERYTLDAAIPIHVNGVLVFWKGIVRGD